MARLKGAVRLVSKADAAREFFLSWHQVDYWFRKFHLEPISVASGDRRSKLLYRYSDARRILLDVSLKRAS